MFKILKPSFIMAMAIVIFFVLLEALTFSGMPAHKRAGGIGGVIFMCAIPAVLGGLSSRSTFFRSMVFRHNAPKEKVSSGGRIIVCISLALAIVFLALA